jgi:tetratricopeptide (TPR) repeat protein
MSLRRQPQRLPPPLTFGAEKIDAEIVLCEFEDDLGLLLWKTVRSVRMWAELPEGERLRAFGREAVKPRLEWIEGPDVPAEIRPLLRECARVLRSGRAEPREIAGACRDLSRWAATLGRPGTAIEYMQAAAILLPEEPVLAREVGRLARARAEFARSETWYRHSVARARRARDWSEFARSYLGVGTVAMLRGNHPQAQRAFIRGLRAAKRHSLHGLTAAAHHEMTVLAIRMGRPRDVVRHARLALQAYPRGHERLPALAHDLAAFAISRGHFREGLRVLLAIPPYYGQPGDQLARAACIVRAAAMAGDVDAYQSGWMAAESLLADPASAERAATALVSLARGARAAGELVRAREMAERARLLATDRGEAALVFAAEGILASIPSAGPAGPAEVKPPSTAPRPLAGLVTELEAALASAGPR